MATFLAEQKVDIVICGGMGQGAKDALESAKIKVYGGVGGSADDAVNNFLAGTLVFNPNVHCEHHAHGVGEHKCGEHGCGSHGCH